MFDMVTLKPRRHNCKHGLRFERTQHRLHCSAHATTEGGLYVFAWREKTESS